MSYRNPAAVRDRAQLGADLLNAWNDHDIDRVTTFYAADYEGVDVAQAVPQRGPEGVRQTLTRYLQAFPDLHFTAESIIAQNNQVVQVWTARGTHQGSILNIPPTGRRVRVRGISHLTVEGDKIRSALYVWDLAGLLREIGLLPEL